MKKLISCALLFIIIFNLTSCFDIDNIFENVVVPEGSVPENTEKTAVVLGLNRDYSLSVRYDDGRTENVNSGQVSIRGFDGYF